MKRCLLLLLALCFLVGCEPAHYEAFGPRERNTLPEGVTPQPAPQLAIPFGVAPTAVCGANVPVMDTRGDLVKEFNNLKATGCTTYRTGISWSTLEPTKGSYTSWYVNRLDYVITTSEQMGLRPVVALFGTPAWASSTGQSGMIPPSNMADYGNAFAWLYNRYTTRILAYEVWNEPNLNPNWGGSANAAQYTNMLKAARAAAPGAFILGGSLSSTVTPFLQTMYDSGAKGNMNALALHPYGWFDPPPGASPSDCSYLPMSYQCGVPLIHDVMINNGDNGEIWFTEIGWTTASGYQSEQQQADYAVQAYNIATNWSYVKMWSWYVLTDLRYLDPTYPLSDKECCFGMYRADLSPKPIVSALAALPKAGVPNTTVPTPTPGGPTLTPTPTRTPVPGTTPAPTRTLPPTPNGGCPRRLTPDEPQPFGCVTPFFTPSSR